MKIKIQSNFNNLIMELIIYAIFIVQFLPLVNVFGKLVVNGISLLLLIAFLVVVLCINRRLSVEFLVILSTIYIVTTSAGENILLFGDL